MSRLMLSAAGVLLASFPALAQQVDLLRAGEQMAGREIRVPDNGRVVGTVLGVKAGEGQGQDPVVVIELDGTGRAVQVPFDQVTRQGNKLYLDVAPDQLAEMPAHDLDATDAPSEALPYGGLTPGWGGAPPGAR